MTIKVKHVLQVLVIIISAIILYRFFNEPVKELLRKYKYGNQIVNNYNFNSFENVTDGSIEEYNYYKNYYNEPDIDITPLIESYIHQIETNEENPFGGKYSVGLTSNIRRTIQSEDYTYIVKMYHGVDRKLSIEELEKVLIHKSKDKYSDWFVPKDSPKIIDLPYNYYLEYEPSDFKLLDNVKKVIKCTFPNDLVIDTSNGRNKVIIEYIDNNNNKQIENSIIYLFKKDKHELGMFYSGLYYTETHNAKIVLKNHDYDEWAIEKAKREKDEPWNWIR